MKFSIRTTWEIVESDLSGNIKPFEVDYTKKTVTLHSGLKNKVKQQYLARALVIIYTEMLKCEFVDLEPRMHEIEKIVKEYCDEQA